MRSVVDRVTRLGEEAAKLGQLTERMQNEGHQERMLSACRNDEMALLKKSEEQLKRKVEQLGEQKLALWQENTTLKAKARYGRGERGGVKQATGDDGVSGPDS